MDLLHKIYTLPTHTGFVNALASGLLNYAKSNDIGLSDIRVFLPTRRACRSLREAFLDITGGQAMLLPFMNPIGDVDEDELVLKIPDTDISKIPPAISTLKRQILLARLIQAMPNMDNGPDQAMKLAHALGLFMDQIIIEGLSLSDLHKIVPEEFADHWQITLNFLKILSDHWPQILKDNGVIDSADRRNRLMHALCDHWEKTDTQNHIIIAGSTGTIPATSKMMRCAVNLKNGAVILPGLDCDIDPQSWDHLDAQHPQNSLKSFLSALDLQAADIKIWPHYQARPDDEFYAARRMLFREIMRPAQTSSQWQTLNANAIRPALHNLNLTAFDSAQDEAMAIALLFRQTLDNDNKTAALVTPDRLLAKRVSAICARWGVNVDDSGGKTLFESLRGQFMNLILETLRDDMRPVSLLSLLKHGLCKNGYNANAYFDCIQGIDEHFLRGSHSYGDLVALSKKTRRYDKPQEQSHIDFILAVNTALAPFDALKDGEKHSFNRFLDAHLEVAENLSATDSDTGAHMLWKGEDGEQSALLFSELSETAQLLPDMTFEDYVGILQSLMQNMSVRPAYGTHPRLMILGQMEARLTQADVMILSGLNEKSWPPDTGHDPWMSRPMRKEYGLPNADMRIGLAAHDMGQCFCAPQLHLTRSKTKDNAPSVTSRWLQRLSTILNGVDIPPESLRDDTLIAYLNMFKHSNAAAQPYLRPQPTPPSHTRPKKLPVTAIENWMRDPYAIYAKYILGLRSLDALEEDMDAALRGSLIHDIFDRFVANYPDTLPDNSGDIIMGYTLDALGNIANEPGFWSFWQPRFERMIAWFLMHESEWRTNAKPALNEAQGSYFFKDLDFTLTAKADRIDTMKDGTIAIIDYKTGQPPNEKSVRDGLSPQLPLEGLIAQNNGFEALHDNPIPSYMGFWRLSGGMLAGEERALKSASTEDFIVDSQAGLESLISRFKDETLPYYSLPDSTRTPRVEFQDYAHLARVQEWAALDDQEDVA